MAGKQKWTSGCKECLRTHVCKKRKIIIDIANVVIWFDVDFTKNCLLVFKGELQWVIRSKELEALL